MKRPLVTIIACIALLAVCCCGFGWDLNSDTWVATDALGRKLPGYKECGPPKPDKVVGMFFFAWHGTHTTAGPYDITNMLKVNPDNPPYGPVTSFHWWGEPEAGYFLAPDPWYLRRSLNMLCHAGVDVLLLDATNEYTYADVYIPLCRMMRRMQQQGQETPKIAFVTWSDSAGVVQKLYDEFYKLKYFPEQWFLWKGKPLILGKLNEKTKSGKYLDQKVKDFFSWRECWFYDSNNPAAYRAGEQKWTWASFYPQELALDKGAPEEVSVAAALHPVYNTGRSFHNGKQPPVDKYYMTKTAGDGYHFTEQWERALKLDPPFVFVTGWNEWTAMRFLYETAGPGNDWIVAGKNLPKKGTYFVDQFNQEFSRDIEPMKGGHTDNYYYQLISYVRKYKGVRAPEPASAPTTVKIDGNFADWKNVQPEYRDPVGDTMHRDFDGWGDLHYTNWTGRNDIVSTKVARDAKYVYFFVQTKRNMTSYKDKNWMMLFVDTDQNSSTGWHGYDYIINYPPTGPNSTSVKKNTGGWNWKSVGSAKYIVSGKTMEIAVPRSMIGQAGAKMVLDFHWADNIQKTNDISEFFLSGDSAPDRRFNYRYSASN